MGKPAARIGDMTAHGGSIILGYPTVLIGGMPAARMLDMHVCPMLTPGVPPIPHVGGPIILGSPTVLIGGMPAARMGDMATCVGPPDTIILGCMTVLIGEAGSGSAGGGGAGGGGVGGAATKAARASAHWAGPEQSSPADTHFIDVTFVDKANLPIGGVMYSMKAPDNRVHKGNLSGPIKRRGVQQGNYEFTLCAIVNARWSVKTADVGDTVDLLVDTVGVDAGTKAVLSIYVKDSNYTDHLLHKIESSVSGDKVKESWKLEVDEKYLAMCAEKDKRGKYSRPFFFFRVFFDDLQEKSGLLFLKDWLEITLTGKDGKPAAGEKYRLRLPNGEIREGSLDGSGHAKIDKVYPSQCQVEFPNMPDVAPQ